jgi:hypothetical protein
MSTRTRALFHNKIEETTGVGLSASARPMVVLSGFYESHELPPSSKARSIVLSHCDGHQNGQKNWVHFASLFC